MYVAVNGIKLKKGYLSQSTAAVKKLVNKKEGVRMYKDVQDHDPGAN